ncbi:MAG: LamB/YcsF family protein [Acidobacteria bacterium]|nr:MAG: LamB/YcsF family protein [Acidobacteriota bacterium]
MRIDLNCDMGESFGIYRIGADEDAMLELVTSANVACGFHAGDPSIIDRTVGLAAKHGVAVGAHPSHHDLRGFGRQNVAASPDEVESDIVYQVGAVLAFAKAHGLPLVHVKPHGALYNQAVTDEELSGAIARGVARVSRDLIFVGLAGSAVMRAAAESNGLRYAGEAFADRVYNPDGTLQSRKIEGSVITDPERAAAQAVSIAAEKQVTAHDGTVVPLDAETLCLHGDNPKALDNARIVRAALRKSGVDVRPIG